MAFEEPAHALLCQRVLAMPTKRHERRPIEFLNREEIEEYVFDKLASRYAEKEEMVGRITGGAAVTVTVAVVFAFTNIILLLRLQ